MTDNVQNGQATKVFASIIREGSITPSDTVDQTATFKSIHVGGAGDITVSRDGGQTTFTYAGLSAGQEKAIASPVRIMATGTDATLLVWENW